MIRLALKLAVAAAALWAVWTFVPVQGRTLAERWRAAGRNPSAFVERGWAELTRKRTSAQTPQARAPGADPRRPAEGHTDADRAAVDRLLSDRLSHGR